MNDKLDIRIIQLAKWKIPKSESIFNNLEDTYLSMGYFDMVNAKEITKEDKKDKEEISPLLFAYKGLHRNSDSKQLEIFENYTIQELIVFTDINNFGTKRIQEFWSNDSLLMFVSLIHIDNESDIKNIIERIKDIFAGSSYLYYFSFDYSGIVLFAKDISIGDYMTKMLMLNCEKLGGIKLIRDSYSLCGFNKEKLRKSFGQFKEKAYNEVDLEGEGSLSVSINIGVQNYDIYDKFLAEVEKVQQVTIKQYGLLGRHDISIVNDNADIKWLVYIQYLLDKYTGISQEEEKEEMAFLTYETFVKANINKVSSEDPITKGEPQFYKKAKEQLQELCDKFFEELEKYADKYNGEYKVPVQEVKYSILSIMKNRFAEDFVLCMYQSFCEFLGYLTNQISQPCEEIMGYDETIDEFDRCFVEYFSGLNSLVNSAMHSERQFIQATAFNAIIYDVPSKIMAFYVAVIDDAQNIVRNNSDKNYTFLLTPSFHNEISVKIISYFPTGNENHLDRILMVRINEKSLYNPQMVICRMIHEIAHFVGDDLRCRERRKENIKFTLMDMLLGQILHKCFVNDQQYDHLVEDIYGLLPVNIIFSNEQKNYSWDLTQLPINMAKEFIENEKIQTKLKNHIKNIMKQHLCSEEKSDVREMLVNYLKSIVEAKYGRSDLLYKLLKIDDLFTDAAIGILVQLVIEDVNKELAYLCMEKNNSYACPADQSVISRVGNCVLWNGGLLQYGKELINIYSETFADLQMVFLTGITYTEYLRELLIGEGLNLSGLEDSIADLSRISMLALVLDGIGFWSIQEESKEFTGDMKSFHEMIARQVYALPYTNLRDRLDTAQKDMVNILRENTGSIENHTSLGEDRKKAGHVYSNNNIINLPLADYLLLCAQKSLSHYEEKKNDIKSFKKTISTIIRFENIFDVFCTVCKELDSYKKKLFNMEEVVGNLYEP